jgi:hypothetical protein
MKINKIAVCMFGQYRTGLELSSTIASYFNIPGKDVDFFCSVKMYNKYFFVSSESDIDYASDNSIVQDITKDILDKYKPKLYNFIFSDSEQTNLSDSHYGLYSALVDSIHLKQEYESKHNFQYDLVIMFRYDTILQPVDYFKKLTKLLESNMDVNGNHILRKTNNYYHNFVLGQTHGMHNDLQNLGDMCFVCNSESADLLYAQLILCQSDKHEFTHKSNTMYNVKVKLYNMSGHAKWPLIFKSVSLDCVEFPYILDDNLVAYDTYLNSYIPGLSQFMTVPVRNSNIIKTEDYIDVSVIKRHHDFLANAYLEKVENQKWN